jgi:hypothetical protein
MLVICNGAMKSGSTWLYNIALEAIPNAPLPEAWRRADWGNPSIAPQRLADYLASGQTDTHVIKAHYSDLPISRDALLAQDVIVLNISRDIRDVVVSHYWFRRKHTGSDMAFDVYFETEGRAFVRRQSAFHAKWDCDAVNYHRFSFEGLLTDFESEITRGESVLRLAGGSVDVDLLKQATTREALIDWHTARKGADLSWFFRKGQIGDWRNTLTASEADKIIDLAGEWAFPFEG